MSTNLVVKPRRNEPIERVIKRCNKKVKKLGLINALSNKNHEKLLLIADDFRSKIKKTKL